MSDPVLMHVGNARKAGRRHGVDPAVILGILSVEGGTDAHGRPVAPADRLGPPSYGQFIYGTGAALNVKYGDSASETDAIARYLVQLGYKTNADRAIGAYNGGPANPRPEYAAKVLQAAKRYTGAGGEPSRPATATRDASRARSSGDASLVDDDTAAGALRALTWLALACGGAALAGLGVRRTLGRAA